MDTVAAAVAPAAAPVVPVARHRSLLASAANEPRKLDLADLIPAMWMRKYVDEDALNVPPPPRCLMPKAGDEGAGVRLTCRP